MAVLVVSDFAPLIQSALLVCRSPMASTLVPIHSDVCGACFRVAGGPASVLCAPLRDAVLHFAGEFVFDMRASHWLHTSFRDERCGHECGGEDLIVASVWPLCEVHLGPCVATDRPPQSMVTLSWVTTSTIRGRGDPHLRCERREYCVLFRRWFLFSLRGDVPSHHGLVPRRLSMRVVPSLRIDGVLGSCFFTCV